MTDHQNHTGLATTPQKAEGHIFEAEAASPLRRVTGKAITPESFRQEIEAVREGYSRNTRRLRGEGGGVTYLLELWPRDIARFGGDPLLISPDTIPKEASRAEWLAQFSFSYDPARYAFRPPERLRGKARLRAFLQSLRWEVCQPVPFRPLPPGGRAWMADREPDQTGSQDTPEDDKAA